MPRKNKVKLFWFYREMSRNGTEILVLFHSADENMLSRLEEVADGFVESVASETSLIERTSSKRRGVCTHRVHLKINSGNDIYSFAYRKAYDAFHPLRYETREQDYLPRSPKIYKRKKFKKAIDKT